MRATFRVDPLEGIVVRQVILLMEAIFSCWVRDSKDLFKTQNTDGCVVLAYQTYLSCWGNMKTSHRVYSIEVISI